MKTQLMEVRKNDISFMSELDPAPNFCDCTGFINMVGGSEIYSLIKVLCFIKNWCGV